MIDNTSGIRPTEFKVLVLPKPVEEVTKGGIILTQQSVDQVKFSGTEGTIIDQGPGAFSYMKDSEWNGAKPKAGDRILLAKFAGVWRKAADGKEYVIINDKDVVAILED